MKNRSYSRFRCQYAPLSSLFLLLVCIALMLSGCVSFHAIEQQRVDQGKLLLNGEADPNAPAKTRKIVGVDIKLPPGPGKKEDEGKVPPPDPASAPREPEKVIEFIPMKGTRSVSDEN
jgi:hypothetical protein